MSIEAYKTALGLNDRERKQYSLFRAIEGALKGKVEGFEKEVSDEIAKKCRKETSTARGFFLPTHDLRLGTRANDANTGTDSEGGYLVGTDHRGDLFVDHLKNRMALVAAGAVTIDGLLGDVAIPTMTAGATAYWLTSEATQITDSLQTFGQETGEPHELGASVDVSKKLLTQSSPAAEQLLLNDLTTELAIAKDAAGLVGTGSAGEPLGITGATGLNTVTIASSNTPTWAEIVDFESAIEADNVSGEMAWVFSPAVKGNLKTIARESGYPTYLMNDNETCNGYPVVVSKQLGSDLGLFGKFSDCLILDWAGTEITVDTMSLSRERLVRVTVHCMTDIVVRHGESFAVSDSAMA